jgi:Fe-S-cluster formation regulator IscX/YfhJ
LNAVERLARKQTTVESQIDGTRQNLTDTQQQLMEIAGYSQDIHHAVEQIASIANVPNPIESEMGR